VGRETRGRIDRPKRRLGERDAGQDAVRLHDEASAALISSVENRLGSDVGQILVQGTTDHCLNFASVHTGMLPSLRPFSYSVR